MRKQLNMEAMMSLVEQDEEANVGLVEMVEDMEHRGYSQESIAEVVEMCDWL